MKPTLILTALTFFAASFSSVSLADHPSTSRDVICQHVEEIRCATTDMKGEIKTHFRGAKGYVRMLAANALLKVKASAILRRVNRDSCYLRLERDAARLSELACVLQERFDEVLDRSTERRPVYGELGHVQAKIDAIRSLANCVRVEACRRLGKDVPVELRNVFVEPVIPEYQIAPGARIIEPLEVVPQIQSILPQRSLKSVLENDDPIIIPPDGQ